MTNAPAWPLALLRGAGPSANFLRTPLTLSRTILAGSKVWRHDQGLSLIVGLPIKRHPGIVSITTQQIP
jgi:hypothetical protein